MLTLDEYRSRTQGASPRSTGASLQPVVQQAVRQDALTGDSLWDSYNAYLEAALQFAERARNGELAALRSPELVNDEKIRVVKIRLAELEARIGAFNEILMLPKFLKENGEKARLQLSDLAAANSSPRK